MRKFLLLALFCCGLWFSVDVDSELVTTIHGSKSFYDIEGRLFHVKLSPASEWQIPIPLDEMGKWLPLVAVNAEDGRFFRHVGVDMLALVRAVFQDVLSMKKVSGASTITTQVIRLSVSEREGRKRTLPTKLREFIMALKLEHSLTKPQILECYLNLAPFGGNIRGVQAASMIYFGKSASQISPGEACLLIGMLKGPAIYRPDTRPASAIKRRNEIISLMERKRAFSHDTAMRARLEELPRRKYPLPSKAWHFTELVTAYRGQELRRYNTTLNLEIQSKLDAILTEALNDVPHGITYAAGIIDNRTAGITAWSGNARFSDGASWVDCGRRPRSPGSTLKPFAYLSALEQGILTPSTVIADTPEGFSGRAPRNFDMTYRGAVTARTALHSSLNVPAARVLRKAGNERVLSLMKSAGFRHLTKSAEFYGDSLILGGCEVTLLEELEAYTFLASMGLHRGLKLLSDDVNVEERLSREGSCWILSDILRNDDEFPRFTNVSVKTGTSYGLRDAWACSWTPDYTVCVWCGNPDGSSWEGLVGARICTPIALKLHRILPPSRGFSRPSSVTTIKVCALSGLPATPLCPSAKLDYALDGVTMTIPCPLHSGNAPRIQAVLTRPTEAMSRLCIVSPTPGASYINAPFDPAPRIPLKAEGSSGNLYWYIDGEYSGMSSASNALFRTIPDGEHRVSVADQDGHTDTVTVKVFTPGKRPTGEKLF